LKPLRLALLCLLAVSLAPIVSAQDDTPSLGDFARQERERRQQNAEADEIARLQEADFQANILITDSHAAIEKWVLMGAADRSGAGRLREVPPNKKFYLPVVVSNYCYTASEKMHLIAHVRIFSPDGKAIFDQRRISGAIGPDPRSPSTIVLNPVVDITFDSHDLPGTYTIRVTIRDNVHSTYAKAEEQFQLIQEKQDSGTAARTPAAPPASGLR